jgi:hypothetical protein
MARSYHSTKDLCERFRCSSRTLFRRMKRSRNPFPLPCMRHAGSCNLWDAREVAEWETRERAHARRSVSQGINGSSGDAPASPEPVLIATPPANARS